MANPSHDKGNTPMEVQPTYMTDEQAERWAWEQVKRDVGTEGWTAGDSGTYFGFFLWGWRYKGKYERQRATPPSPSTAPEVDERAAFEAWAGPREFDLRRPHKTYHNTCTDYAWMGWQARAALASRPAEVDDEGLPPLPEGTPIMQIADETGSGSRAYTAEQYRQGQRDAVAADRARRGVGSKIPRESNDALIKLAKYWKLDGDWMTCRGCRRSLIASRDGEELNHGDGCKFWDQHHPWAQLRELIAQRPAPAESVP